MSDLTFFEDAAANLHALQEPGETNWSGSAFSWMKSIAPVSVGVVGAALIRAWASEAGYFVADGSRGCNFLVDGCRVEVRTSLRWRDGFFSFAQMRDENYDEVAMLGIEPRRVRIWRVPKAVCLEQPCQHGRETHWLRFLADEAPSWMECHLVVDTSSVIRDLSLF